MARDRQQMLLNFPSKGVVVTTPKNEQPEDSCHDALNVRVVDQIESRTRGGSRPGLSKYSSARQSANRAQDLNYVTTIANSISATSLSRRTVIPVVVTNGVIGQFNTTAITNASVAGSQVLGNAAQVPFTFSTESFQRLYYASGFGYKVYVGANNAAIDWTPTAGSLPGDQGNNVVCRIVEQWRGRIILSALPTDPHNWFMSKLGDPLNWDYLPATETVLDAIQGGSGTIGKVPDIVQAIIPYNDDVLLFGCLHSIWMMSGDPMDGGGLDLVTNTVGMAFGRPYCQLPDGTLMFVSNRGSVYRMAPGAGKPQSVTSDSIDPILTNTNMNTNLIRMAYDEDSNGVHLFITPLAGATNTVHWWYDLTSQGWFKVTFADNTYNPVALMAFDGDTAADRVILTGGDDGYIRKFDASAFRDDGQAFTSYVVMGPIVADKGRLPTILTDVQFVMDDTSSNTKYELGTGDTAEAALADFSVAFTGEVYLNNTAVSILAGRSINHNPRTRGHFQYFKIGATAATVAWAIEYIQASYSTVKSSKGRVIAESSYAYTAPGDPPSLSNTDLLYGAWWVCDRYVTRTGTDVTAWLPFQAGDAQSPPTFVNTSSDEPVYETLNTAFNNKGVIQLTSSTMGLTANVAAAAMNFSSGFVTAAFYVVTKGTGTTIPWEVLEAGNTMKANWTSSASSIQWTGGSANQQTANATIATNTLYIVTWTGGTWRSWQSTSAARTYTQDNNVGIWWGDHGVGTHTINIMVPGSATGWNIKLAAVAIYNNTQSNTVIRAVENSMATYYGFAIP